MLGVKFPATQGGLVSDPGIGPVVGVGEGDHCEQRASWHLHLVQRGREISGELVSQMMQRGLVITAEPMLE